jgi:hypothetical protein
MITYVPCANSLYEIPVNYTGSKYIRPCTNNDVSYTDIIGSGRARPIKHYRRGHPTTYNPSRVPKSGYGMPGLLNYTQEYPGTNIRSAASDIGNASISIPTQVYKSTFPSQCPYRIPYTSPTEVGYKDGSTQYLQSRCKTYSQNAYDFVSPATGINEYIPKCNTIYPHNTIACNSTSTYKPSNYQYAVQGAVSASARTFRASTSYPNPYLNSYPKYYNNSISSLGIVSGTRRHCGTAGSAACGTAGRG